MSLEYINELIAMNDADLEEALSCIANSDGSAEVVSFRSALSLAIKEAMRDQRHACAEAVIQIQQFNKTGEPVCFIEEAHQAVMNAEVK